MYLFGTNGLIQPPVLSSVSKPHLGKSDGVVPCLELGVGGDGLAHLLHLLVGLAQEAVLHVLWELKEQ